MELSDLPIWLQGAIQNIKDAAGVKVLDGRTVTLLRQQVLAFCKGVSLGHDDYLPMPAHDAMMDAIAYNDDLAARDLTRQSVESLVEKGKWRQAPSRKPSREAKSKKMQDSEETPEQARARRAREDGARTAHQQREDHERWQRDAPNIPFSEWSRLRHQRLDLWMQYCADHPQVPRLPIPPLLEDGTLDVGWTTKGGLRPAPACGALQQSVASLPAMESTLEVQAQHFALP